MKKNNKGFTLIELLIVIAIIAILALAVVLALDPVELMRKSRDTQRISDLSTMKSAINLYISDVSTVSIGDHTQTYASKAVAGSGYTGSTDTSNDGTGWIPIDFTSVSTGAPVSNEPLDPVNSSDGENLYYRYGLNTSNQYEIDCSLESTYYTSTNNILIKDGGDSTTRYEVGTLLTILGATAPSDS